VPYYQGDYYRGDYYQGDPGILGFLGKAFKTVAGVGASVLPGVGGIAGRLIAKIPTPVKRIVTTGTQAIIKHPVLSGAAAAGVVGAGSVLTAPSGGAMTMPGGAIVGPGRAGLPAVAGAAGMKGFHVIKRGPHAGMLARNRRMRVTNPKALRRAIRRAKGFEKLARRVMHFTSPKPPRGRAVFKARRRKK